jgi:hypothetical protein
MAKMPLLVPIFSMINKLCDKGKSALPECVEMR